MMLIFRNNRKSSIVFVGKLQQNFIEEFFLKIRKQFNYNVHLPISYFFPDHQPNRTKLLEHAYSDILLSINLFRSTNLKSLSHFSFHLVDLLATSAFIFLEFR